MNNDFFLLLGLNVLEINIMSISFGKVLSSYHIYSQNAPGVFRPLLMCLHTQGTRLSVGSQQTRFAKPVSAK